VRALRAARWDAALFRGEVHDAPRRVGKAPRRRVEGTYAVAFAALIVAALAVLLSADAYRQRGFMIAERSTLAVLLGIVVMLTVGVVDLRLADARRRAERREARLRTALARFEGVHGFARTVGVGLEEIRSVLRARDATLATRESETGHAILWMQATQRARSERALVSGLDAAGRSEWLFDTAASAWIASRRRTGGWDVLALSEEGSRLRGDEVVSVAALERLSQRLGADRLAGLDARRGSEWEGRVVVVEPDVGARPEESLRLAQRFMHETSGVVQSRFLLGRLRARVGAMERARIARELHDGTIQSLVAIEMELELLRRRAEGPGSAPAGELSRVKALLHQEILDLRDTMQRLKPAEIEPRELVGFLDEAVARFGRETGIRAIFDCDAEDVDLSPRVCREIARIVQEALQNVRKHSVASSVLVRLEAEPAGFRLVVDDDGQGFAGFSGTLSDAELEASRRGPYVIRERVRALGGNLSIVSSEGGGARLEITVPRELQ
jgi:signal transduction histidine kinase